MCVYFYAINLKQAIHCLLLVGPGTVSIGLHNLTKIDSGHYERLTLMPNKYQHENCSPGNIGFTDFGPIFICKT